MGLTSAWQSQGLCGPSISQRKWDFTAHFSTMTRVGGNPMARTGAVRMISIWHSSTFSHSWFTFELLVHLDLCRWFNKQTQYIVHHTNCIIKLLTYFQTSSFYSSVSLSFPSFPLLSLISNPRKAFAFFPKPDTIKDPIMSEVSPTALQTAHCWRILAGAVWEITANTSPSQRKLGYILTPGKAPDSSPSCLAFVKGHPSWSSEGFQDHWGTTRGQFLLILTCWKE